MQDRAGVLPSRVAGEFGHSSVEMINRTATRRRVGQAKSELDCNIAHKHSFLQGKSKWPPGEYSRRETAIRAAELFLCATLRGTSSSNPFLTLRLRA
jgi:hypothetical protein